jgi:hypothetical protein
LSDPPTGNVVHALRGRLRVKVPDRRRNGAYFSAVAAELAGCPGVQSVEANALTASLLIVHDTENQTVAQFALDRGLLKMDFSPARAAETTDAERWLGALSDASTRITAASGGRGDLTSALAGIFLILAVIQLARRQVAVPAVTALWYAIEALSLGQRLRAAPDNPPSHSPINP